MPKIHHPVLRVEQDVPDAQVPIWTSTRSPWKTGPLPKARKRNRPTANNPSPLGDTNTPDPED